MAVTHYTNHVCVVATGKSVYVQARDRGGSYDVNAEFTRYSNEYPSCAHPHGSTMCTGGGRRASIHTVNRAQVTCKRCLRALARDALANHLLAKANNPVGSYKNWASHDERTERAWLLCCRDRGHVYPFTGEQLATLERARLVELIKKHIDINNTFARMPGTIRELVMEGWTAIPDELREPMRAAIDEMTMATDLLEEVSRMFARARITIAAVAADVAAGTLSINASAAVEHVTAAVAQRKAAA